MDTRNTLIALTLATFAPTAFGAPLDRVMDKLDADGDGQISQAEWQASDRSMVKRMDANDDGVVTRDEIASHIDKREARMAEKLANARSMLDEHFNEADANGDGMVTAEEAKQARFSKMDSNADGLLSPEELRNARPPGKHGKFAGRKHPPHHGPDNEV